MRGGWGLGEPEVLKGARGYARLLGVVPVAALTLVHRVEPRGRGSLVAIDIQAPRALEPVVRATYGPIVGLLVRRLARVAEHE